MKRLLLITVGTAAVALGTVGILVPVLPTTPFLLLAAYCYLRSSDKLYAWLIHHRIFGHHLYVYITYRAVRLKTKVAALVFLWLSLSASALIVNQWEVRILLLLIGLAVSLHILRLKTYPPDSPGDSDGSSKDDGSVKP